MSNKFTYKYHLFTGEKLNGLELILLLSNSILDDILPVVVFFASYSSLIFLLYYIWRIPISIPDNNEALATVLLVFNIGLPALLVFRTNTAHERFWEARKLWGNLVNTVRNLTRNIYIIKQQQYQENRQEKEEILLLIVAFAMAMKLHLREEKINDDLLQFMTKNQYFQLKHCSDHPPLQIALWIGNYLQLQYNNNYIHVHQVVMLHQLVDRLVDILGGCERILKTPLPVVYTLMLKKLVIVYCLLLPFEIIDDCRGFTIIVVTFASIVLFGIEQIGSQLEQPFAYNANALPLDLICNTISKNIKELIRQTNYDNQSTPSVN